MKTVTAAAMSCLLLEACATVPSTEVPSSGAGDDCAVIAAVAKEHYGFGPEMALPLLRFEGGYRPNCNWDQYGLDLPIYDPDLPDHAPESGSWVSFQKPTYDGQGAVIESSARSGPRVGGGIRCRVRSGFAGWTVDRCEPTWAH